MNIAQALEIINPPSNNMDGLKCGYRLACKLYHPDINPNGLEMMKLINLAFDFLKKNLGKWRFDTSREAGTPNLAEAIQEIFDKIKAWHGIKAEVCGSWLWIGGQTWRYKKELKEMGLKWANNKRKWYWSPAGYRKRSRRVFTMDEIRQTWGSTELEQEPLEAIG